MIEGKLDEQHDQKSADLRLAAEEVMAAVRELFECGGLDDVFDRLPDHCSSDQ